MESKEELEWWEKQDEPKPTEEDLIKKIEEMRLAAQGIPKAIVLKQFFALVFILLNGAVLFSAIHASLGYSLLVYLFTLPSIVLHLDYLFTVRALRKIAEGKQ